MYRCDIGFIFKANFKHRRFNCGYEGEVYSIDSWDLVGAALFI